jgi:hypothetical protein
MISSKAETQKKAFWGNTFDQVDRVQPVARVESRALRELALLGPISTTLGRFQISAKLN